MARRFPFARNVEAAKRCRKCERREMGGRQARDERQGGGDFAQGEHGFDALTDCHAIACKPATDAVPQLMSHCAPGIGHIRSERHTSDLPSTIRTSYPLFCMQHKTYNKTPATHTNNNK